MINIFEIRISACGRSFKSIDQIVKNLSASLHVDEDQLLTTTREIMPKTPFSSTHSQSSVTSAKSNTLLFQKNMTF